MHDMHRLGYIFNMVCAYCIDYSRTVIRFSLILTFLSRDDDDVRVPTSI